VAVEDARAVLVGDAQLVAEALRDEEHRRLALALEERVGGDRRAHLHRLDLLDRDRRARRDAEEWRIAAIAASRYCSGFSESSLCVTTSRRACGPRRR
jgi:hypothetical protein